MDLVFNRTIIILLLFSGAIGGFSQQSAEERPYPEKSVRIHILDFFRTLSPAIKMSYEIAPALNYSLSYEASLISDFSGRHIMSIFNPNSVKSIYGFSLGFYPMISIRKYGFAGFRVNYSFKFRKMEEWVPRYGGNFSQKMEFKHQTHSAGLYFRYLIRQGFLENNYFSVGLNAGMLGSYVESSLPDDVVHNTANWIDSMQLLKAEGFHLHPHIYLEFNLGFPLLIQEIKPNQF